MVVVNTEARGTPRRAYNSPVREESARLTRRRLVVAAHGLFLERGFARCSVSDIAEAAGVARPTVLSVFGTKAALLKAVVDDAMAGDDEPVPINERPWMARVFAASTHDATLSEYARACLLINRRSAEVIELARRASDEGPEIAELWDQLQRNRMIGAGSIVRHLRGIGPLPSGLSKARATESLWMLNDSAHFRALVLESGWSEKAYVRWLTGLMRYSLLDAGPGH